jgi:SAM-dependent methyltransferase
VDRFRFSAIAHRRHVYCNPLSVAKVEQIIDLLDLPAGARALDVGCGKAELLVRLAERYGACGVGVDLSPHFLADAREKIAARLPRGGVSIHETDVARFAAEPASFDLAINMGATWLQGGGFSGAVAALSGLARPGGLVLVADGYWKKEPYTWHLEAFGMKREEIRSHAENVAAAVAAGLTPLYAAVSSEDEWDHYEGMYWGSVERWAREHPEDPEVAEMLERIRMMRDSYLGWRREAMGFGIYLLRT